MSDTSDSLVKCKAGQPQEDNQLKNCRTTDHHENASQCSPFCSACLALWGVCSVASFSGVTSFPSKRHFRTMKVMVLVCHSNDTDVFVSYWMVLWEVSPPTLLFGW